MSAEKLLCAVYFYGMTPSIQDKCSPNMSAARTVRPSSRQSQDMDSIADPAKMPKEKQNSLRKYYKCCSADNYVFVFTLSRTIILARSKAFLKII